MKEFVSANGSLSISGLLRCTAVGQVQKKALNIRKIDTGTTCNNIVAYKSVCIDVIEDVGYVTCNSTQALIIHGSII